MRLWGYDVRVRGSVSVSARIGCALAVGVAVFLTPLAAVADPPPEPGVNPGGPAPAAPVSGTGALADLQSLSATIQQQVLDAQVAVAAANKDLEAEQAKATRPPPRSSRRRPT